MAQPSDAMQTINDLFRHASARDKADLLNFKRAGQWQKLSASQLAELVRAATLGLHALGVQPGDRVAILSENRYEWIVADFAVLNAAAVDVPIYATQAAKQVSYILQDAGVEVLFISNQKQYDRVREVLTNQTKLRVIISFDKIDTGAIGGRVLQFDEFLNWGRAADQTDASLYEKLSHSATPDSLATLIYTSGTTGEPKGVMLSHRNLTWVITGNLDRSQVTENDTALTFLPFSHILERATITMLLYSRCTVFLAESVDTVPQDLLHARPHFMTSVPRLYEKIYAKTLEKAEAGGALQTRIANWAFDIARQYGELASERKEISGALKLKHKIADKLILSKWRAAFGGRVRVLVSGGAPLSRELAFIFYGAGLPIYEGYGLTESAPTISVNHPAKYRLGSVGPIAGGVTVQIAEDGEILATGPNIMQGYYNRPDATAETLTTDAEGRVWLHTGDIGHLDADGFLYITDRKKDLLKTSGGKYIAPQPIENALKRSRFVNQVVVIGDNRKFPAALIVPHTEMLKSYADLKKITYANDADLLTHPQIIDLMERQVDKFTEELAKFEKLKAVALLPKELTIESGELTPTLKVKRRVVTDKYKDMIDQLYAAKEVAHGSNQH